MDKILYLSQCINGLEARVRDLESRAVVVSKADAEICWDPIAGRERIAKLVSQVNESHAERERLRDLIKIACWDRDRADDRAREAEAKCDVEYERGFANGKSYIPPEIKELKAKLKDTEAQFSTLYLANESLVRQLESSRAAWVQVAKMAEAWGKP